MNIKQALKIILDLAVDNMLSEKDCDNTEELLEDRKLQQKAYKKVVRLFNIL